MVTFCTTCEDNNKVIRFSCVRVTSATKVPEGEILRLRGYCIIIPKNLSICLTLVAAKNPVKYYRHRPIA